MSSSDARFMDAQSVCQALDIGPTQLARLRRTGAIRKVTLGAKTYYDAKSVDAYKATRQSPDHNVEKITDGELIAYSIEGVCKITSLGRTSVYRLVNEGKLKSVKIYGRTMILRQSVLDLFGV